MKNASEEVMKLFSKSGSLSGSSANATSGGDVTALNQELAELKTNYRQANEVGGVLGVAPELRCITGCVHCVVGVGRVKGESV